MANYVLPQVLVFQEFTSATVAAETPLLACIVGEQFALFRYNQPTEKLQILVANSYDPSVNTCYTWPNRPAGGVVDESYTQVFFDNALLEYFHTPASSLNPVVWTGPNKNRIRASDIVWQTANGFTRDGALLRDVQIGDAIQLLASACGGPVTLESTVIGLLADQVPAVVGSAYADASNQGVLSPSTSSSQTAGKKNDVAISAVSGASYNGLADGNPTEVYTVEVIGASVGADATTAILKVTSASGNDNQAAITPDAFGSPTPIGTRGLTVTWNESGSSSTGGAPVPPMDFLVGQTWVVHVTQAYTPPTELSGGSYAGPSNTSYIVQVTLGGKFSDAVKPQVTVSTTTGIDLSGPTTVTASGVFVPIGSQGVLIKFTGTALDKGDRFYVPVTAVANGAVSTLLLANNLPDAMRGDCVINSSSSSSAASPYLDVTLYIKKNIEVTEDRVGFAPLVNWTQDATELCLQEGIVSYDSSWQIGGVLQPLPVANGTVYLQYRARLPENCTTVGTITDISTVPTVLGTVDPDNPLAFGVYNALSNANGQPVKFLGVCGASALVLDNWLSAIAILVGRSDVYSLVPLTQEEDVLEAFSAHCTDQSTPTNGCWRICWLNMAAENPIPIYTTDHATPTNPVLATIIQDPDLPPPAYVDVESPGQTFITSGVLPLDTVRALYSSDGFGNLTYTEFTVDSVINEETIRLVSGPSAPVNVPSKIEIWRTLNATQLATNLATYPGIYASRRAFLVWPDTIGNAGTTFPGFHLCAALAGLRSGVLPQQGLTNIPVVGFDDVSRTTVLFSAAQLNTMAGSGYWIVTQDPNTGVVYTRHQLSTGDQTQLNYKEQSITTNLDSISFVFLNALAPYIGQGNVTQTMINILQGEILAIITQLSNNVTVDRLGPQIISAKIVTLAPDPVLLDRIDCVINLTLPYPLNNVELHLVV